MCESIDLSQYSNLWQQDQGGLWRAGNITTVSYPADGNEDCFRLEQDSFWFQHRNRIITSLIAEFPPAGVFFDVGGGNGFVAKALQDTGRKVVLVEPGLSGALNARQRGVVNVVQSMWTSEFVKDNTVSAIGLFDVVEHIEDDLRFLASMNQSMSMGGRIYITVPAYRWLWSYEDVHAGHFRRYRLPRLGQLLTDTGFAVEFSSYFFSPLPLPILIQRSIPGLLGLRRTTNSTTTVNEHTQDRGLLGKILQSILGWEARRISKLKKVLIGSSCVIVGRKISNVSNSF